MRRTLTARWAADADRYDRVSDFGSISAPLIISRDCTLTARSLHAARTVVIR